MGMKLGNGADLCGYELLNFCIQSSLQTVDAPALGRKYFHTGVGEEGKYSLTRRERIYVGDGKWRAAAYVDDLANLDITSNEDFLALKTKVEAFLDGEVDSNGVLDNLKEIQKFLDNYSSATDLTDILNTKFDKTGGNISGKGLRPLIVETDANAIETQYKTVDGIKIYLGWLETEGMFLQEGVSAHYLGILPNGIPYFHDGTKHTLLHEGNVGDYALKTDGSNAMQVGIKFNVFNIDLNVGLGDGIRLIDRSGANGPTGTTWWQTFSAVGSNGGFQFSTFPSHEKSLVFLRTCGNSESSWKDWREIAFTDSTVEAAKKLVTDNGGDLAYFANNTFYVGDTIYPNYETHILGYNIVLRSSPSATTGFILNSSGNVLIGTTDDNGAKLQVNGNAKIEVGNRLHIFADNVFASYDKTIGGFYMYGGIREGEALSCEVAGVGGSWVGAGFKLMQNGNFGIGLTPSAQLHVSHDIVANGTIACKGVAAEGSAPVGTVDKWAGSIASGTKSQTYTHGLGTTDITVAIYEKNGNEWVQILTDVDIVNANSIRVTFGSNTTVEHRIVVMG